MGGGGGGGVGGGGGGGAEQTTRSHAIRKKRREEKIGENEELLALPQRSRRSIEISVLCRAGKKVLISKRLHACGK